MANMKPNDPVEKIVVQLRTEATRLWGEQRATELEASLQQTAQQLLRCSSHRLPAGCHFSRNSGLWITTRKASRTR